LFSHGLWNTWDRNEISKKHNGSKQRRNNNSNDWRSAKLFSISEEDFKSLCFKIFRAKVAKPHIFYKLTVVVAKKWSTSLKHSNTDLFIKLYGNILNIISLLSLIFLYKTNIKREQIEEMIKTTNSAWVIAVLRTQPENDR